MLYRCVCVCACVVTKLWLSLYTRAFNITQMLGSRTNMDGMGKGSPPTRPDTAGDADLGLRGSRATSPIFAASKHSLNDK